MAEEWLLQGAASEADRSRLRYLLDQPPPPDPQRRVASAPSGRTGSPPRARRPGGISLAEAQRLAREAEEWDRSMGA